MSNVLGRHVESRTKRLLISTCTECVAQKLESVATDPLVAVPLYGATSNTMLSLISYPQVAVGLHKVNWLYLAAKLRDRDEVIGGVCVAESTIAYFIAPEFWGQGYGLEMVSSICALLHEQLGLNLLKATVLRENIGSRRVLEKTGFQFRGLSIRPWSNGRGIAYILNFELLHLT